MPIQPLRALCTLTLFATLVACRAGDDPIDDDGGDGDGDVGAGEPCDPADDPVDESACVPLATDYLPMDSDADSYEACISDGGVYELVSDPPGSIARVEAADEIADLLWRNDAPTRDDFTMARAAYEFDQGLGSRVERREDLHYPEIPEAEWDPGLDPDKQCSNTQNAENHPDRCAGPVQIRPLINDAFIAGMSGEGDPNVHAARIEAAIVWFSYLSVYKEAFTCVATPKDCDSAWAYYTGGAQADGDVIGFAKLVRDYSPTAHQRIFDGILAVRCFRDLYSIDDFPTYADLPAEGQALFDNAWEQLDDALARGFVVALRQHLLAHDDEQCSEALEANWAFVQIAGGALDRELREHDATAADELAAIYALSEPGTADIERAVELLDSVIPCG
ncbi:hypothetical protein ENSA7_32990 [Enhygromyxa salina]|uniref:Uncharacterized protein n=1 Tax=Enhygromyxa salina TaxID=215803 RepID=A0A2S9YPE5_9BACT|nr:hypothetical protein ENSA7_32990 [Enhygromyxa salina]